MSDEFSSEPDPFEITVSAEVVGRRGGIAILHAVVEDGTDAYGGDIEVQISEPAAGEFGIDACINELERVLNQTLRPAYRLSAALAMGSHGAFLIVPTANSGPRVVIPTGAELAA